MFYYPVYQPEFQGHLKFILFFTCPCFSFAMDWAFVGAGNYFIVIVVIIVMFEFVTQNRSYFIIAFFTITLYIII